MTSAKEEAPLGSPAAVPTRATAPPDEGAAAAACGAAISGRASAAAMRANLRISRR